VNESDQDNGNEQGQNGEGGGYASSAGVAEERIAALTAERDEMKDRMLRIAAEFENWKKRARKEQEDAEAKVRESVLRDMLDVTDNLERAIGAYGAPAGQSAKEAKKNGAAPAPDGAAVLKGVELVLRLLQSKFERHGVKPIEATGQPFDPRLHEAISRVETTAVPAGHVASEMQRGYRIGERLLRPSMVAVAAAPATAAAQGDGSAGDDNA
jgi:molecular chaperone GrpE